MEEVAINFPVLGAILTIAGAISGYFVVQLNYYRGKLKDADVKLSNTEKYYQGVIKEKDEYLKVRNEMLSQLYTKTETCMLEVTLTLQRLSKDAEKSDGTVAEHMVKISKDISEIKQALVGALKNGTSSS